MAKAPNPAVIDKADDTIPEAPNPAVIDKADVSDDPYEMVPCVATGMGLAEAGTITHIMRKDVAEAIARGHIENPDAAPSEEAGE
jgi:hypothetical protein